MFSFSGIALELKLPIWRHGLDQVRFYKLGDIVLESEEILSDARIGFANFGSLNEARDNAILVLTHFGGTHLDSQHLIGSNKALEIVIISLIK